MADIQDPFTPGPTRDPTAGVDPDTFAKVRGEWNTFMENPQGRAALLSAGLALMQPPSFGDTTTSQIGRAIGAAGQSATANQAMDIRESEAASKQDLRESQASAAEARARTAGMGSELGYQRLEHAKEKSAAGQQLRLLQAKLRASTMYETYRKNVEEQNFLNPKEKQVVPMSKSEFIQSNPLLKGTGLLADDADTEIPESVSSTTTGARSTGRTPTPAAIEALKANPGRRAEFDRYYGSGAAAKALGE